MIFSASQQTKLDPIGERSGSIRGSRTKAPTISKFEISPQQQPFIENQPIALKLPDGKVFPVFEDKVIARYSIDYWLYFEFLRGSIRLFIRTFICFAIFYGVLFFYKNADESKLSIYFGIAAGVMLVLFRHLEEKRVIEDKTVSKFLWTEDLFSLLIENIPRDVTKEQLKEYFNQLLSSSQSSSLSVRNIILVKDFYEYVQLRQKCEKVQSQIDQTTKESYKQELMKQKHDLKVQLELQENQLLNFNLHHGKAIVIFNTTGARDIIHQKLRTRFSRNLIQFFASVTNKNNLDTQTLRAKQLPDPEDLVFQNICYSKTIRSLRVLAINLIILLALWKSIDLLLPIINAGLSNRDMPFWGGMLASCIFIVTFEIITRILKYINTFYVHLSASETRLHYLSYLIYSSIIVYTFCQTFFVGGVKIKWQRQIPQTTILFCLQSVLLRVVMALWESRPVNQFLIRSRDKARFSIISKLIGFFIYENPEFNIVEEIRPINTILLMNFTFFILSPLMVLPVTIICLYLFAIIDKYRVIHSCALWKATSAYYVLGVFRIFHWDHFCVFFGIYWTIMLSDGSKKYAIFPSNPNFNNMLTAAIVIYLAFLLIFGLPKALNGRFKEHLAQSNSQVHYDLVCHNFPSTYESKDICYIVSKEREKGQYC